MSYALALANLANSSLRQMSGISPEMWDAAVASLMNHWSHDKLKRPFMMTLVDFTKSSKERRLWCFNLVLQVPLVYTTVAHGKMSGGIGVPKRFSNVAGSNKSCLGGFATYHRIHNSKLGGVTGTGLRVHGLDRKMNNRAMYRGIIFHGAKYVSDSGAGRSLGCFATPPTVNERLLPLIVGGTFVYAWAGPSPTID